MSGLHFPSLPRSGVQRRGFYPPHRQSSRIFLGNATASAPAVVRIVPCIKGSEVAARAGAKRWLIVWGNMQPYGMPNDSPAGRQVKCHLFVAFCRPPVPPTTGQALRFRRIRTTAPPEASSIIAAGSGTV